MSLSETRTDYRSGKMSKQQYIDAMFIYHTALFEYAKLIPNTDISSIEINDGFVLMTSRTSGVKILCKAADKRIAPIDILNFDFYEKTDSGMIFRLIEQGFNVFDIGANVGWYTLNIAKAFDKVNVFAFEPIPFTFRQLKRNVEINNVKNVKAYNFGFSNRNEELTFYVESEMSVSASSANLSNNQNVQEVICSVKRLDDFVSESGVSVDFIKCDVEGAELLVFKGGIESISHYKPIIFAEMLRKWSAKFNYHPNEIIDLLSKIGYRCFTAKGEKLIEFYKMDEDTVESTFFFLHSEKHTSKADRLIKD